MNPSDTVALVTGGARRVGRAIAVGLAEAGCRIALHYHSSGEEARAAADELRAAGREVILVPGDLDDPATPRKLVDQVVHAVGRLDILVNSAAVFEPTPFDGMDPAAWDRIFRVNVTAAAMLARAAAPIMRQAGGGRIINITDILGDRPIRRYDAYCASKAALASLTRSLAIELAPEVTVNAVAPGIAEFPEDYDTDTRERLTARVPLMRAGTPQDVAALVRFLVTTGDYITGQIIAVDGGRSIVL